MCYVVNLSKLNLVVPTFFRPEVIASRAHLRIKTEIFYSDIPLFLPDTLVSKKPCLVRVRAGGASRRRPFLPIRQRIRHSIVTKHLFLNDFFDNTISSPRRLHKPHPLLYRFVIRIFKLDLLKRPKNFCLCFFLRLSGC